MSILQGRGHHVISVTVPLRGVASDARYLSDVVRTVEGPIVLVGHSYGGAVISNTDRDAADIRFIWGQVDYNTPAQAHAFMARGAGARTATEVAGASHVVGISHPRRTAAVISRATNAAVHSRRPS